jgi:His/Glu/Gln/Arg/opine family amino acid ABC transporter permease subunit
MGYHFDWSVVFSTATLHITITGLEYTLVVSVLSLALGSCIGLVAALARGSRRFPFSQIAYVYTDFFRTTPILVQIVWIFYVLPILMGINFDAVTAGVIALGLNSGAFFSEVFRAGIESVGQGQRDAASVLGLSRIATMRRIVLPQALRRVVAPTGNMFISLVKDSSILSIIGVTELLYQYQSQASVTFRPLELYTALAVVYFLLTYPMSLGISALERRYPMSTS